MAAMDTVRHEVASVGFRFYTADEIRQMSVVEITQPYGFDTFNRPVEDGLYDPRCSSVADDARR